MTSTIKAFVGLGNPGPDYSLTRHNVGALWIEHLAAQCSVTLKAEKRLSGLYARAKFGSQDIHLLIPTTFMNRSGNAVQALAQYYKIAPENILVAHDELDISPGTVRLKKGGGHGGHNGLRDIIRAFGGDREFPRLRLGIGHPGEKHKVVNFVLDRLNQNDREKLEAVFHAVDSHIAEIANDQWSRAMNQLHGFQA